jgi:flagellar hook-associated protein 1
MYNIYLVDSNGNPIKDGSGNIIYLVQGSTANSFSFPNMEDTDGDNVPESNVQKLVLAGNDIFFAPSPTFDITFPSGKLRGLIEAFGYKYDSGGGTFVNKGIYPEMISNLDNLAYTFGTLFNNIHQQGFELNSNTNGSNFFTGLTTITDAAKNIQLSPTIDTFSRIAASTKANQSGNGNNAINLANVGKMILSSTAENLVDIATPLNIVALNLPLKSGTIKSNYEGWIGKLGVDGQQAERLKNNSEVLRQSVEERRQSVSSVSLDEEMTNMIKYQHAYNAAARQITVIDEMLDKIINGMGIVGR